MRTAEEIRAHFLERLALALKYPRMFGGELSFHNFLEDLLYIDGKEDDFKANLESLIAQGYFTSMGICGAFLYKFGGSRSRWEDSDEVASVYAEMAYSFGCLALHRTLSKIEWKTMRKGLRRLCRDRNWTRSEILEEFGPASFSNGPSGGGVLCYATANRTEKWIFFDFEERRLEDQTSRDIIKDRGNLTLRDARLPAIDFSHSIVLTPFGRTLISQPSRT